MSVGDPPQNPAFDVALEPAPKTDVIDAAEDEEDAAKRAAGLASTYDPAIAHAGKTDEELIAEREAQGRMMLDAAIALGVVVAAAEAEAGVTPGTIDAAEAETAGLETEDGPPTDTEEGE
jgi:hypothetical protein